MASQAIVGVAPAEIPSHVRVACLDSDEEVVGQGVIDSGHELVAEQNVGQVVVVQRVRAGQIRVFGPAFSGRQIREVFPTRIPQILPGDFHARFRDAGAHAHVRDHLGERAVEIVIEVAKEVIRAHVADDFAGLHELDRLVPQRGRILHAA